MVSSLAFMLVGTLAATPCESLKSVPLPETTITSAQLVPEGPAPQRGAPNAAAALGNERGGGGGGARGAAPAGRGAAPAAGRGAAPGQAAQPPARIPAHCRVTMVLKPTADSNINV